MRRSAPKLRDVAAAVGISVATVSKVLNGYSDVSAGTREAVLEAAQQLGYPMPGQIAPMAEQSCRVAMLIEDYRPGDVSSVLIYDVLMGFRHAMSEWDCEVILLSTSSEQQKRRKLRSLIDYHNLRGAFIMGLKTSDPYLSEVKESEFPCVLFDVPIERPRAAWIGVDGLRGAAMAVEHLLKLGHRRIGFINGHEQAFVSAERMDGFAFALHRAGLSLDPDCVVHADFTEAGGEAAALALLGAQPELTALFCAGDLMAIGAMKAARRMGLFVPKDLSVVGFDNILMAEHVQPALTTIDQPKFQMGMLAAQLLQNLITDEAIGRLQIPPTLVVRGSTAELHL